MKDTEFYQHLLGFRAPRPVGAPWAEGSSPFTLLFEGRVIDVLRACDVQAAAALTGLTWDRVWGRIAALPSRIGVDEKPFAKRHRYETLVYDLDPDGSGWSM